MRYMVDGKAATAAEYAAAPAGKCKAIIFIDSEEDIAARAAEEASKAKCASCGSPCGRRLKRIKEKF